MKIVKELEREKIKIRKFFIFKGTKYYTSRLLAEQNREAGERIYFEMGLGYRILRKNER